PPFEMIPVLSALRIFVNEIEELKIAGGVANGFGPMLELKEPHVPEIVERAFGEQLHAFVCTQLKLLFDPRSLGFCQAFEMKLQDGFDSMRTRAVGPPLHFKLL